MASLMRVLAPMVATDDPLEAERKVSGLLGRAWDAAETPKYNESVGYAVINAALHDGASAGLAVLRVMTLLGTEEQRALAGEAASALDGRGIAEPPWAGTIGRVEVGECWRLTDVFGDTASVLCMFSYGDREHCVFTVLNHNEGSMAVQTLINSNGSQAIESLRQEAKDQGVDFAPLSPAEARAMLEYGFEETDRADDPPVLENYAAELAVVRARLRAMPEPVAGARPEVSDAERDAIVAEFLASDEGRRLAGELPELATDGRDIWATDPESARRYARMIVDYGCDHDGGKPMRVSPIKLAGFTVHWMRNQATLDPGAKNFPAPAVGLWAQWAAKRNELPNDAATTLIAELGELFDTFASAYRAVYDADPSAGKAAGKD